ncbi:415_t:CDS:1, partial [Cetraspora pellucida]
MLIKNPSEVILHIKEEENLLILKETQDMNMEKTCLQEQETKENISDYDIDKKVDILFTEISIKNSLNTVQKL